MSTCLREWAPLSDLFNALPIKVQNGLFSQNVRLTSVDILPEFLALGSNIGIVYWYDRKKKDIQKLRCESVNEPITALKIISTVDYMVACGNSEGNITIFQVPKSHHESLPDNLRPKSKQVERYTVSDLHHAPVTSLEWSKNGMKLFSGDKNGHVVLTEIDFYMHICKSIEILNESYEVVQLSYFHEVLLISTTYRSIICKKEDKWKISQVGKRDRKILGNFGGTFYQNSLRPNDTVVYCTRPGLRIWVSDIQGSVQQTLLFKDLLNQRTPEVTLINPVSKSLKNLLPQKEVSFGILLPFKDNLLVTYSNDVLYILNPTELVVSTMVNHLRGILSVAIYKDEVFILEGERSLIRLSNRPEPLHEVASNETASNFSPITTLFKGLSNKLQNSNIMPAFPTPFGNDLNTRTDSISVSNAEEARESPFSTPIKQKIYDQISNQDFDSILFKQKRYKKSDLLTNASSCSSTSSEENEGQISLGTLMAVSTLGIMPDLRSPESIEHDIEVKEKMLAGILHFDDVKISCDVKQYTSSKSHSEVPQKLGNLEDAEDAALIHNEKEPCPEKCNEYIKSKSSKMPVCLNIPSDWQLETIHVSAKEDSASLNPTKNCQKILENVNFTSDARRIRESSISDLSGEWEII